MNGEDYFSNPGEQRWLNDNAGRFGEIALGLNVDGAGYRDGATAYSLYECAPPLAARLESVLAAQPGFVRGEAWVQGDHSLFVFNGRPALAFTSERAPELVASVIHTPRDTPALVDGAKLEALAQALRAVVLALKDAV
jgi:aminopeptidase YwaD